MRKILFRASACCSLLLALSACKQKELDKLDDSAAALREVFAAETAQVAGAKKQVVLIVPAATQGPSASLGGDFKSAMQKKGLSVVELIPVQLGDPMKFNNFGLKAADFFDVLRQHSDVGAIVSLVGAPLLHAGDLANLPATRPPVLIVATRQIGLAPGIPASGPVLEQLLRAKIIQAAVIDGSGSSGKTDTAHKKFDQQFQILRPNP